MQDIFGNIDPWKPWYADLDQYEQLPLWEGDAPGFNAAFEQRNPSVSLFLAPEAKGKGCVLVMAGGGYTNKAPHEGPMTAIKLQKSGVNAAVLDYRLVPYKKEFILADAKRAVRYLRYHAESFGINQEIAVLGYSAGGNLAAMAGFFADDGDPDATDPIERMSSRPTLAVIAYPGINFVPEYEEEEVEAGSEDFDIMSYFDFVYEKGMSFPPAFIWQSFGDHLINYKTSFELVNIVRQLGSPVELHVFPYGEHGQGLAIDPNDRDNRDNQLTSVWSDLCSRWLKFYGF